MEHGRHQSSHLSATSATCHCGATSIAYHLCPIKGSIQCKTYKFTEQRNRFRQCPTCQCLGQANCATAVKHRNPEEQKTDRRVDFHDICLSSQMCKMAAYRMYRVSWDQSSITLSHQKATQPTRTVEPPLPFHPLENSSSCTRPETRIASCPILHYFLLVSPNQQKSLATWKFTSHSRH